MVAVAGCSCAAEPCPALKNDGHADWDSGTAGVYAHGKCVPGYTGRPQRLCLLDGWQDIADACQRTCNVRSARSTGSTRELTLDRSALRLGVRVGPQRFPALVVSSAMPSSGTRLPARRCAARARWALAARPSECARTTASSATRPRSRSRAPVRPVQRARCAGRRLL